MSNRPTSQTFTMRVNLECCKSCKVKFTKALRKLDGECLINPDKERGVVYVNSSILESETILETLRKIRIDAKILKVIKVTEEEVTEAEHEDEDEDDHEDEEEHMNEHRKNHAEGRGKKHSHRRKKASQGGGKDRGAREGSDHVIEEYSMPSDPQIDPSICRDKYCTKHPRRTPMGGNYGVPNFPMRPNSLYGPPLGYGLPNGYCPPRGYGPPAPGPYYPGGFGPPYGHHRPYGHAPMGRPMEGMDFYGDGNPRGCNTM